MKNWARKFAEDRISRVTNPSRANETKHWTTNIYDDASRIKEVVLPDGAKVNTDYGVSVSGVIGVTKQITDQAGKKRKGFSNALGRMVRVVEDPDNSNLNTDYVFDTLGNLRKTIQGEQSRYFTYDSLGRLLYAKQPEQEANTSFLFTDQITNNSAWSVKYEYDDNGNIWRTTDARNVSVTGTYDNFNRLGKRDYFDTTPDVDFYYDGRGLPSIPNFSKGKTTRVASSVSETRYTSFDNLGRLLSSEQRTPFADETAENTAPRVSTYQYNLSGALVQETYPSGRTVSYNLDEDGDLESVRGQKPNNSAKLYLDQIKYNSAGAIERMRLGNGRWESAVYNTRGQIMQIGLGYSDTDKSLIKLDYDYGSNTQNNGSLIQQKISFRGLTSEIKQDYIYDNLNRLKSSTETVGSQVSWKQTFNYDRYGNRTFDSANTTTINQSVSWKATNPLINTGDNRLKKDQDGDTITDYEYDKAGNLTLDAENRRFVFDAENRMKEFFHGTNTSTTPDAVYFYDGEGRRVRKVSGNRQTIFVYNSSGTLIAEYDSQLATNPQVSYLTADHLGSPRVITDGRGAVISRHDYMAFGSDITETIGNVGGRTTAQGFNSADEVRKQYTGYERDDESGLDFAQARYYNSSHGRFTSIDPLTASATVRNPQTFNRYSYVLNSPYKFVDPLGLISSSTIACGQECGNGMYGGGMISEYGNNGSTIKIGSGQTEGAGPIAHSADDAPAMENTDRSDSSGSPTESAPTAALSDPPPCTEENPDYIVNALKNGKLTDRSIGESTRWDKNKKAAVSNGTASHDGIHLTTEDGKPSDITALKAMEGTILHSGKQATTGLDAKLGLVDILLNKKINGEHFVLTLKDIDYDTMQKSGDVNKGNVIGRISRPSEGGSITLHVTLMPYSVYKKFIEGKESAKARNSVPFGSLMDAARDSNSPFRMCLK